MNTLNTIRTNTTTLRQDLANTVAQSSYEVVDIARALIAVPSMYPPGDTHGVANVIESMFEGIDVEIERYETLPHVMNLVIRIHGVREGRRLVFNGHMDTFPLINAEQWSTDFNGEKREEKLYGLGVSDMKGGIAAIIFALRHLATVRESFFGEVVATFVGDEESMGTNGSQYLLTAIPHAAGDAMISADAGSPQVLRFGEKGMIWLSLEVTGKSAHAAHVHKGKCAIEILIDVMQELKVLRNFPVLSPPKVLDAITASTERSELLNGKGESDVLRNVTITFGTISGGRLANLIADHATATADIRLPVGVSVAQVESRIVDIVSNYPSVKLEIMRRYEPSWTNPDHEVIRLLKKNCEHRLGTEPVVNMRVGASDARLYRRHGVPSVVCGLTSYNMGGADEHVYIEELRALGEIFALTAFDFLNERTADIH